MTLAAHRESVHGQAAAELWLARCRLPLYVGEVARVTKKRAGRAGSLSLYCGACFVIPDDAASASWSSLAPGDLVAVRWRSAISGVRIVGSVDSLDQRVCIVSQAALSAALLSTETR